MMQAASPMPHLLLPRSPLVPGRSPVRIGYRDSDDGREIGRPDVLVVLHGGWGAGIYSFDRQIAALDRHRVIVPDRTGYGASETIDVQPVDFHQPAAEETLAVLDALGLERASFWGHSDGAVIAFKVALMAPDRVDRIVAEATHFFRRKPRSRGFFESMRDRPEQFGGRVSKALEIDHGSRWRALLTVNGEAWLHLADSAGDGQADLYDGRLADVRSPVLLVHGEADPRTEPGELDALRGALPHANIAVLPGAFHSPHSERAAADAVTDLVRRFLG
jgi:pimeloyl-ACP methyl ester carboxylesterase